jgi:hypothetical protein
MNLPQRIRLSRRRTFLGRSARGLGGLALATMLGPARLVAGQAGEPDVPDGLRRDADGRPRVSRVIFLYMAGGPSHLETFDYKPELARLDGEPMPESFTKGQPIAQLQGKALRCLAPQHRFGRFGQSGQEICTLFPQIGGIADNICIIRSMTTEAINHDPAHTFLNTGTTISGRPSMGSWVTYGLGSEAEDLPSFVVLTSQGRGGQDQPIASRQWHSGFLPGRFQGVHLRGQGDPVLYLGRPDGVGPDQQRDVVRAVQALNARRDEVLDDPEIATRISQYEMAFRMQASIPGLMDLSGESAESLALYGTRGADGSFAANCLLARRLAERGVRFIQLYHRDWDHHSQLRKDIAFKAEEVDRPSAALITDLERRGLLDETLVIWGGEFGRTPMAQGNGRDHHIKGFSMWLAGGGIKGGIVHGQTDELGYNAVENVVQVHDLHATMLHLLGVDHRRLTYKYQGRDFRLTDVAGRVVEEILA